MGWRDFFTMGLDRMESCGEYYADTFAKIRDPAQLRRRFAFHTAILLILAPAGAFLFVYYTHYSLNSGLIPGFVLLAIYFWNLCHAYRHRRQELAEGRAIPVDNLGSLRRRFAPSFGIFLSLIAVGVVKFLWDFAWSGSVGLGSFIVLAIVLAIPCAVLYAEWLDYKRLKNKLASSGTTESATASAPE